MKIFRQKISKVLGLLLLALVATTANAYTKCTEYPAPDGSCSTRCNFFNDKTGAYQGYIDYGWCD